MQKYLITRGLEGIVKSENLEVERNVLFNYENQDHRYVIFDPTNIRKAGERKPYDAWLDCMFTTAEWLGSERLKRNVAIQQKKNPDNKAIIFDLEEDAVYAPALYEPLPGKKVQDGILDYLSKRDDLFTPDTTAELDRILEQEERLANPANDPGRAELKKLQDTYLNLTVTDASKKAEDDGLEMIVSWEDGKWNRSLDPPRSLYADPKYHWRNEEHKPNRFGVFVYEGKVVAIAHDTNNYSNDDDLGNTLVYG